MRVREVDPRDDGQRAAWCAVLDASLEHERPGEPHWSSAEQRASALRHRPAPGAHRGALPHEDVLLHLGDAGRLLSPHLADTHLADLEPHVHPGAHRRALAKALLAQARRRAAEDGRTHLGVEVDDVTPDVPGVGFARRRGFACQLRGTRRDPALPVDPARLDALEAQARPHAPGYELCAGQDRTPDELLADRAIIEARLSTDAPAGDLPYEQEAWDGAHIRDREALSAGQSRIALSAGALRDPLVAQGEVGVPLAVPERADQWGTLVLAEHRGHRLGMLAKVAALRALQAVSPSTRLVSTWNADSDRPMTAVDESVGFVPAGTGSSWMQRLAAP